MDSTGIPKPCVEIPHRDVLLLLYLLTKPAVDTQS